MSIVVIIDLVAFDSFASETPDSAFVDSWEEKIDSVLLEKMKTESNDIPVWIWFTDIDDATIDNEVYERIGMTEESLSIIEENMPSDLSVMLGDYESADEKTQEDVETKFRLYLERTQQQRDAEKAKTDIYISCLRDVQNDLYDDHNKRIISGFGLSSRKIIMDDNQGPFCIAELSKK